MGGCMGCSVALAFGARFPEATRGLLLHWPVGGYRWKMTGTERFTRHLRFARENGLAAVVKRTHEGTSFYQDPEASGISKSSPRACGRSTTGRRRRARSPRRCSA
jgi:hypothetical protein